MRHHPETIRLNSFQQMMLKWNDLYPYNAGHVIELSGTPNIANWNKETFKTIQEIGLGIPQFQENQSQVQFFPISNITILTPSANLNTHIGNELNKAFLNNEFPIRFFIICEDNQRYFFGAIYNHWIADSFSMRALFQRIYDRYYQMGTDLPPMSLNAPSIRRIFQKFLPRVRLFGTLSELFSNLFYYQSAYRVKLSDTLDFNMGFNRYYLPEGIIKQLSIYAKSKKVTINDVFLTALAKTLGEFTLPDRKIQKRKKHRLFTRNRLAFGTIVDTRHLLENKLDNIFGQYLSNYTHLLKNPELYTFDDLLKKISQQTHKIKNTFQFIKNFASWDLALWAWNYLTKPKSKARFFNKNAPIIAGISNVNLTHSWIGKASRHDVLDYLRISPAGVLLPVVFTLTTLHDQLSLCITYRTTAFTQEEIIKIYNTFLENLKNNCNSP